MQDLRIATVSCRCTPGSLARNLSQMAHWIRKAEQRRVQLVCFPEMNLSGYSLTEDMHCIAQPLPGLITERLGVLAKHHDMVILAGTVEAGLRRQLYASHLVVMPDGKWHVYRKVHLAPPEQDLFAAGRKVPVFKAKGLRFGIQLCYDAHFPELTTRMALAGADAVFMPHASPRGTPQSKLQSWLRHLTARAFDNGVFVIAVNQCGRYDNGSMFPGVSIVVGPSGLILKKALSRRAHMMVVDLKAEVLAQVRGHRMRYFLPHRRPELYAAR